LGKQDPENQEQQQKSQQMATPITNQEANGGTVMNNKEPSLLTTFTDGSNMMNSSRFVTGILIKSQSKGDTVNLRVIE